MPTLFSGPRAEGGAPVAVPLTAEPLPLGGAALCRRGDKTVLFVPPGVPILVNGRPVPAGIRVLAHRDQLHTAAGAWWFLAEDAPVVVPFPGSPADVCPRCRQHFLAQSPAVRCACGNWYHQAADLGCFTYSATCSICKRPTTLEEAAAFSVEE